MIKVFVFPNCQYIKMYHYILWYVTIYSVVLFGHGFVPL